MTHMRVDSLLWGVLLAYGFHFEPERYRMIAARVRSFVPYALALAILPALVWEVLSSRYLMTIGFTVLGLAFAGLLAVVLSANRAPGIVIRLFAPIGASSYAVYLWHLPVGEWIVRPFGGPFWLSVPIYFAVAIGFGMAMTRLVEEPCLRFRDRKWPSKMEHPRSGNRAIAGPELARVKRRAPSPSCLQGQRCRDEVGTRTWP
jgi:peptidoglycan/LPS O-acetylase OafA/YrhL